MIGSHPNKGANSWNILQLASFRIQKQSSKEFGSSDEIELSSTKNVISVIPNQEQQQNWLIIYHSALKFMWENSNGTILKKYEEIRENATSWT